jgi:hypothetical protein
MSQVLDYRANLQAQKRWAKMDTTEEVIARFNGLPITAKALAAELFDRAPSEYCAPTHDSA